MTPEQEKKWMGEFDNKFSSQWSSETDNCGEYISGSRAIAWQVYLSARKSAQVEIDGYLKAANMTIERLRNKLKDRDQEIERLKKQVNFFKDTELAEMIDQLKERDELIKEFIDTFDLFDEVPLPFKIVNKMDSVVKKARKPVGEG